MYKITIIFLLLLAMSTSCTQTSPAMSAGKNMALLKAELQKVNSKTDYSKYKFSTRMRIAKAKKSSNEYYKSLVLLPTDPTKVIANYKRAVRDSKLAVEAVLEEDGNNEQAVRIRKMIIDMEQGMSRIPLLSQLTSNDTVYNALLANLLKYL